MKEKRYLEFVHLTSGMIAARADVTGKSEETIMKRVRVMLTNAGECWYVRDTQDGFRYLAPGKEGAA